MKTQFPHPHQSSRALSITYLRLHRVCFVLQLVLFLSAVSLQAQKVVQWKAADGIYGGTVNCLLALNDQEFYAGTEVGLFYTASSGAQWEQKGFKAASVMSLAAVGDTLYAGLQFSEEDGSGGLFRSVDQGSTWQGALKTEEVYAMDMQSDMLVVGTSTNGVYLSSHGSSWKNVLPGNTVWAVHRENNTILVATDSAVFRSTNGGDSWAKSGLSARGVFYAFCSSNVGICAGGENGVFKSTDAGASWSLLALKGQAVYALASDNTKLYIGTDTSGLVTRTHSTGTLNIADIQDESVYAVALSPSSCLVGTWEDGIYISSDGAESFVDMNAGLTASPMRCFATSQNTAYAAGDGLSYSTDNGRNWQWSSLYAQVNAMYCDETRIQAYADDGMYESIDGGDTWSQPADLQGTALYCVCDGADGLSMYCGTESGGLWRSVDMGQHWKPSGLDSGTVYAVLRDGTQLYVAMADGRVLHSDTAATKWTTVLFDSTVSMLSLQKTATSLIVGTDGNDVYRSLDHGANWTHHVLNPILENWVTSFTNFDTVVYAGTWGYGVYRSFDGGQSWLAENDHLSNPFVNAMGLSGDALLCATEGRGVFYASTVVADIEDEKIVSELELHCKPIPASSILNVELPKGWTSLRLYDVQGNECLRRERSCDEWKLQIECTELHTGLYLLVAHADSGLHAVRCFIQH